MDPPRYAGIMALRGLAGILLSVMVITETATATVVSDVRSALSRQDYAAAEALIKQAQAAGGDKAEIAAAYSWLGRSALANKQYSQARQYVATARRMVEEVLRQRPLDADTQLPIALGAAIEVEAQSLAAQQQRDEAVALLQKELQTFGKTSIRGRLHKNLNLLSLEGKPAPALGTDAYAGTRPQALSSLRGKPVLLFFWAHWCPDCKAQGPVLARLQQEFSKQGLQIIAPTQHYGYVAGGQEAMPQQETAYIAAMLRSEYGSISNLSVPIDTETFMNYGASTTPTLVLIDKKGIVRFYHPGRMTYEELLPKVRAVL